MNISKLTITPIQTGCRGFVRHNPTRQIAEVLIKERLNAGSFYGSQKFPTKTPKNLPDWVNRACRVLPKGNI